MDIQPAEISAILKKKVKEFGKEAEVSEIGQVLSVGDGIARIYGLDNVEAGELVEFPGDQISISYYSRNYMDRIWTLLHECGHLIDMINGDLRTNPYYWKGEKINRDIPYYERPWEINAEKWAKILFFSVVVDTLEEVSKESED